ncbi:SBBP repeat-containing protein [Desulfococcaceae bacterium HSG8]|nr:SBBP repeat-containing protein [Desulfococcaceae bacterium HSG8]
MKKIRIPFVENRGQAPEKVKFYARMFGGTVSVTENGDIIYSFPKTGPGRAVKGLVIKESFAHGTVRQVAGTEQAVTKFSYFKGKDRSGWQNNIPTYESVSLGEIYKGITSELRAWGNNIEKRFYVNPGADPGNIRIRLNGADSLKIHETGRLEAETDMGVIAFTEPVAYQEKGGKRTYVKAAYSIIKGNEYGFRIGDYDTEEKLIIDPLLASTFQGGSDDEWTWSIVSDTSGDIFIAGMTRSSDFLMTPGVYDETFNAGSDIFISRLNSDLSTLSASTLIGGSSDELATSVTLNKDGNIYVTGRTFSNDFPTTPGSYDETHGGGSDVFISRISKDLSTLSASSFIGGNDSDSGDAVITDGNGNIYLCGQTSSHDFPTTPGSYLENHSAANMIFISRMDNDLTTLSAATFLGQSEPGWSSAIAWDGKGNIYVAGTANTSDFPTTPGAHDETFNGETDIFISKLTGDLTKLSASSFLGGSWRDGFYGSSCIALNESGNVYVTGTTYSPDFPVTSGAYDETFNGGDEEHESDIFVSELTSNLSALSASTFLGGSSGEGFEGSSAMLLDNEGNVYVAGGTSSPDFPVMPYAYDKAYNLGRDIFLSRLSGNLTTLSASTFLGKGASLVVGAAIASDEAGNIYIAGNTDSPDIPMTPGAYQENHSGARDIFILKLDSYLSALPFLFNFEGNTAEGWEASDQEGGRAISAVSPSADETYSGKYSLAMDVNLDHADPDLGEGAAFVMIPGDSEGRTIKMQVMFPPGAKGDPENPNRVQLFVTDQASEIQASEWLTIGEDVPEGEWTEIEFTPTRTEDGADPANIVTAGICLNAGNGAFRGTCFLDFVRTDPAPLVVPESDYFFDFNQITPEQQIQKPFGYGPYWDADIECGTAWNSEDIAVQGGALAITARFDPSDSDATGKGYIVAELQPNAGISNKKNRIIRAEIKCDPYIGPERMRAAILLYDQQDAGTDCQGDDCLWYRSADVRIGGHDWNEIVFDPDAPGSFPDAGTCMGYLLPSEITDDSLENILRIAIEISCDEAYNGTIFLDNITIGGKENTANFKNLNQEFITRNGSDFQHGGQPYRFAGNHRHDLFYKPHFIIDDVMETMQRNSLTVLRTWGFGDGIPTTGTGEASSFQPESGLYYEPVFVNLDYVIRSAGEHGIRLLLPLVNYGSDFGGMAQYLEWCGVNPGNLHEFYTDSCVKAAYKKYISAVINRVNTLTGITYKDDPTIFAWELTNAPRCENAENCGNGELFHAWVTEMSAYIRSLDSNHLIGIGDEGFLNEDGNTDPFYNGHYGVNWEQNLSIETVDFGTVHVLPDLWDKDTDWASAWITDHVEIGEKIGKPVIIEAFGVRTDRDAVYTQWVSLFEDSGSDGDMVRMLAGKIRDESDSSADDDFAFWETDSEMAIIRQHAEKMSGKGDMNCDGSVTLHDALIGLRICSGTSLASMICKDNGDEKISTEDVVWVLHKLAAD